MKPSKTLSSLFANDVPFPKLDVAGSSPVSRSMILLIHSACVRLYDTLR
jgi:hypothetical protein